VVAVVEEDLEAVDFEVEEDLAEEDLEAVDLVEDIVVVEGVVVEDLLEGLAHHAQLQALEVDLIHIDIIDLIVDITGHRGGIIDLGITGGGIPHGGQDIIIALGIILRCTLVGVLHPLFYSH
jgi:hypothetical protein